MKRAAAIILLLAVLFCGCSQDTAVVGQWVSDDNPAYYFELYEDQTCVMFDAEDEWVSSGTYRVDDQQVYFQMDTGSFTWVRVGAAMKFEAGQSVTEYHLVP